MIIKCGSGEKFPIMLWDFLSLALFLEYFTDKPLISILIRSHLRFKSSISMYFLPEIVDLHATMTRNFHQAMYVCVGLCIAVYIKAV